MRIAVFSDVHGNPIALEACLGRLDELDADERVFLGDVAGYLPGEVDCLRLLRAAGFSFQQGNHEEMLLEPGESAERNEAVYRLAEARERLPAEALAEIAAWPRLRTAEVGGRRILFVHGSPDDPLWGYVYPDSDLSAFDASPYDVVIMGNTHRPFAQTRDGRLIANPGSVGLPRDVGDLASFAVLDLDAGACEHHRVRIDVERLLDWAGDRIAPDTRASFERRADDFVGELGG